MRRDPDTGEALTDYGQPMPSLAEVWDGPPRQVTVCRCGECWFCAELAKYPADPFRAGANIADPFALTAENARADYRGFAMFVAGVLGTVSSDDEQRVAVIRAAAGRYGVDIDPAPSESDGCCGESADEFCQPCPRRTRDYRAPRFRPAAPSEGDRA